jgi:hypothetical protein
MKRLKDEWGGVGELAPIPENPESLSIPEPPLPKPPDGPQPRSMRNSVVSYTAADCEFLMARQIEAEVCR